MAAPVILVFSLVHTLGSVTCKHCSSSWHTWALYQYEVRLILEDWACSLPSWLSCPLSNSHWGSTSFLTVASPALTICCGMNIWWIWAIPTTLGLDKWLSSHCLRRLHIKSPISTMAMNPELGTWREWPITAFLYPSQYGRGSGLISGFLITTLFPLLEWPSHPDQFKKVLKEQTLLKSDPRGKKTLYLHSCWSYSLLQIT